MIRLVNAAKARSRAIAERARLRYRWLDHLVRTHQRYRHCSGDRLAGAFTYFAFLSFFPLIALAFSVFGYFAAARPEILTILTKAIYAQLPGLAERLPLEQIADARVPAGIIGLGGLLYAGLGAVDAMRYALREIWMAGLPRHNPLVGRLRDLVTLLLVGVTALASVAVGGFATSATGTVTGWFGLAGSPWGGAAVWLAGLGAALLADLAIFLVLFGWLAAPSQPFGVVLRGALLGAAGFGLLKQLAVLLLAHTLRNPVYGTFAVVVGLLLWINLSARVVLYAAAWTATAMLGPPPTPTPAPWPVLPPRARPAGPG
ncbi:trehalose-binding protein [Thermobispora bispora]|uniref:Ribonuclease BN n=1 Tax=Thermobispora bispora (strain ATCC 19993 / DSM 43833 / CBS 139.67 / JCM 10125 / KCTC 9307 / NBRC 14880 / R51) TaxID=469371 RepID=D6Y5Q0_THEBD|nr:YihY/virulence factor BrkB family protein [Thermobispora bispora]ADG87396.1 ribonuclease BN [Thermobispora bispora DSM 43833]MBO2472737.1 hypothetical protein [Actinomycetales bacterium]MDI9579838.1 YihY/virulence factor BrkB family protein [Thermobispora sp.]QSI47340.1 YihY/virulence factor BrkB family protein [Thermobispora bispora]